jgi:hypothetical protein
MVPMSVWGAGSARVLLALCCAVTEVEALLAWLCGFEAKVGKVRELSKNVAILEASAVGESLVPNMPKPWAMKSPTPFVVVASVE